jgi:hypothetical protein
LNRLSPFLIVLLAVGSPTHLISQHASSRMAPSDRPIPAFGFVPAGSMVSEKRNAPFSAIAVERYDQTLNDGTTISKENQEVVMRDSAGRIYRGRELGRFGNSERDRLVFFNVTDPVKQVQFHCIAFSKHCTQLGYKRPVRHARFSAIKQRDITVEDLGESDINGVRALGQRITRVIPEGSVGNDRPFETVEEVWRSSELGVDLQVKRTDPRFGVRTSELTQLNTEEPDPKFFQLPEGYSVNRRSGSEGAFAPAPASGLPAIPSIAPGIP